MKIKNEACKKILEQVNRIVIGKEQIAARLLAAMLAGGHVLLTDIPGVGKTTLAMRFPAPVNWNRSGCSLPRTYCRRT